jgi:hypothetical protein
MSPSEKPGDPQSVYTIIRLAYDATVERACELAHLDKVEVALIQKVGERTPEKLPENYRIVSFDGAQMTISERINGERRVRGFAVKEETKKTTKKV